jgi:sulfur relay (sulfurtransferase) DsrC/TusE family protein
VIIDKERFLDVLRDPTVLAEFNLGHWDALLPMVNQIDMLPHLVARLDTAGRSDSLPKRLAIHLEAARIRFRKQRRVVYWEVGQIESALASIDIPIVLLKGAAYLFRALDISHGRVYSDIDIMVPKASITEVAHTLQQHGWKQPEELADQEQYYQRWMHELLPLIHERRGTKIDVHHNILPSIDRLQFDAKTLFANAQPVSEDSRVCTLAPVDMVLHNIVHLFRNGEYQRALRDLVDLDTLLKEFSRHDDDFCNQMMARAEELNLLTPCHWAFRYVRKYFNTPIPPAIVMQCRKGKPIWPSDWLMDHLFDLASFPVQITRKEHGRRYARWLLERYPLNLLRKSILPKLERKGIFVINPKY